jgi:ribulose 1,5-bisphosphate synthetase/thiazole synthase
MRAAEDAIVKSFRGAVPSSIVDSMELSQVDGPDHVSPTSDATALSGVKVAQQGP